jgi:hypothetical protein
MPPGLGCDKTWVQILPTKKKKKKEFRRFSFLTIELEQKSEAELGRPTAFNELSSDHFKHIISGEEDVLQLYPIFSLRTTQIYQQIIERF